MTTIHDIFVRAYAVAVDQKRENKHKGAQDSDTKWPEHVLLFDTESRITADQSLTFGVYYLCTLVNGEYKTTEEGLFHADDLPAKELRMLKKYQHTAIPDVQSFPPSFPLYSRSDFMKRIFWPAIRRDGAVICGFNLPFDISRLAISWAKGNANEWSLTMSQFANGRENKYRPHILIKPIDSKKAFIKLARPWEPQTWKNNGYAKFLDLRTLAWSLFNKSFSLRTLCQELGTFFQKFDHAPTGWVTVEEIDYARQDGRCTVDALKALKKEFDKHPIKLLPNHSYSPASVAKSYLDAMGIIRPLEKFKIPKKILGIAMQSYYGGRSETRTRCVEVPVVPVDFTSEYPTSCVLMNLFEIVTAKRLAFEDDTVNVRRFLSSISNDDCFVPSEWMKLRFFALVKPENDILPVRTVYDGRTQNIGNNYLTSDTPIWFAGPDLIASKLLTGKTPRILRAIRMVPHGKQPGMRSVNLRGSMVEIDPYTDDIFRKVIEQRKLNKADKSLHYWLKIFANSIYGFFVELIPEARTKNVPVTVFSGNTKFNDSTDVIENPGNWFFPPLASLITAAGRLLLAMTEACVQQKRGTYLFCDTDSLAAVSSKRGGTLNIPGAPDRRVLSWKEVDEIVDKFSSLNPYDRQIVKGSILNLVDANFVDCDPDRGRRQLHGYSIAAKRYALYEKKGDSDIRIIDPKAHGIGFLYPPKDSPKDWEHPTPQWIFEMWDYIVRRSLKLECEPPSWVNLPQMMRVNVTTYNVLKMIGQWQDARPYNFLFLPMVDPLFGYAFPRRKGERVLLISPFSSKQDQWFDLDCTNVYDAKHYKLIDPTVKRERIPSNAVFPSQFAQRLIEYEEHPEAKSLAPDGGPCLPETRGLLGRASIVVGEIRYVGKETDRKWEEGDDISVLESKNTEYGRSKRVLASEDVKNKIKNIGINKCARESGFDRKNFIRKLVRDIPVKRNSYAEFERWLQGYKMGTRD